MFQEALPLRAIMDLTKLPVEICQQLCGILSDAVAKLELIASFPLDPADYNSSDQGVCLAVIDKETFRPCSKIQGELNIKKLEDDCAEIIQLFRDVSNELHNEKSFANLIKYVEHASHHSRHMKETLNECHRQKNKAKDLEKTLKNLDSVEKQKLNDIDSEILNLKLMNEQLFISCEQEKKYCKAYVEGQLQQTKFELDQSAKSLDHQRIEMVSESLMTEDAFLKVCKFYRTKITEHQTETARVSAEYDKQIEEVETQYQIVSEERRQLLLKVKDEHEKAAQQELELKAHEERKRKKAAAEKLRELQEVKIVVIQSWWRGLMVRRHLGKFKAFKKRAREIKKEFKAARAERNKKRK